MPPRGCGRRAGRRSDCWLVAVRTRTDKGCHSFTRRTNPPSSTTEECPPWLDSFLPGNVSASCRPRPTGRCATGSHEHTATVYGILCQPRPAPLISRSAWRTDGNLLWHESDPRAPPPLNWLAESLTLAVC